MRLILAALMTCALAATPAAASDAWQDTLAQARGQTVYFHAWAGDPSINAYIDWVGAQVEAQFGVRLQHVKNADPAEAVAQVLAEKTAGRDDGGSVDLIWLNGENFYAMKSQALLYGPFAEDLPNFSLVDIEGKPTTLVDFGVPTDGYESPWGMAQFVFIYDTAYLAEPPRSIDALFDYAHANPGRLTYPEPPDFIGSTFLKHVLIESLDDPAVLQQPATDETFAKLTEAMWPMLEAVQPALWRSGQAYPASGPAMHQLLADGEIDVSMAFNPVEASRAIADGILPDTVRTFILEDGTIANSHFVAIPYNAAHKAGALVVANYLLSPEAQAEKLKPEVWGDGTVLDLRALSAEQRALFEAIPRGIATLPPEALEPRLLEPHPSWMTRIEEVWQERFAG